MKLSRQDFGPVSVLRVEASRVDAAAAIAFKDSFRQALPEAASIVVLDMEPVAFLDSSGLGAVVAARKLVGADRKMDLACLSPTVDKVMKLTRMDMVFAIHATVAEALAQNGVDTAA